MEAVTKADTVVFDKTGTLTKGSFFVTEIHPVGMSEDELMEITAVAESFSDHPISLSLKRHVKLQLDTGRVSDTEELSGRGVKP